MKKKQLVIGDNLKAEISNFSFGGNTYKNFDKHIVKSVPNYLEGHKIICQLSSFFVTNNSIVYDLGCSTGSLIKKIDQYNSSLNINIYGIDNEKKMILAAKKITLNQKIKLISNVQIFLRQNLKNLI